MRGRKPKPTALKVIQGNPGHRPLNHFEPKPDPLERLTPPRHLRADARTIWRQLASELARCGLISKLDVHRLELLVIHLARHRQLYARQVALEAKPNEAVTPDDLDMLAKIGRALRQEAEIAKSLGGGFGLDPSDRVRLHVDPSKVKSAEANPLARFLSTK